MSPAVTPYLSDLFARRPVIELETHPSVELLPTIVTGLWPHEHRCWQVRLKAETPRSPAQRVADRMPRLLTTTVQCLAHAFDSTFDLPTIEPRRRRRFEFHRIKMQRRAGGGLHRHDFGQQPTVFSAADGCHRTLFLFRDAERPMEALIREGPRLDFLELYALDLFSHWNLDRPEEMRAAYARTDRFVAAAAERAKRLGRRVLLLVDHGQEQVRRVLNVHELINEAGLDPDEFCFYIEVTNARFWFFSDRARDALHRVLSRCSGASWLGNSDMGRYHVCFRDEDGFGDAYLIADPGVVFFPHDFYHPLVNAYMSRKTPEQRPRSVSPIHRGAHGYLPGTPSERGRLIALDDDVEPVAMRGLLIDVAPTLLSLLGAPIPGTMRGTPLLRVRA